MNATTQAFPAPSGLRAARSQIPRMAGDADRGNAGRTPPPIEKRFTPPIHPDGAHMGARNPWPRVPGLRRSGYQSAVALGRSPAAWGVTALVVTVSVLGVAMHLAGQITGPVVVHLVWPV